MVTATLEAQEVQSRTYSNRAMRFKPLSEMGQAVRISDQVVARHHEAVALLSRRQSELNAVDAAIAGVSWDSDPVQLSAPMNQRAALEAVLAKVQAHVKECERAIPNAGNLFTVIRRLEKAWMTLDAVTDDEVFTPQSPAQRRQIADARRAEIFSLTGCRPE